MEEHVASKPRIVMSRVLNGFRWRLVGNSPSHKREYVEWLTEAKTQATRTRRLESAMEWMAEGKSRHWKYKNC
jgi:hypothetical protein